MDTLYSWAFYGMISAPVSVPAILALFRTAPQHSRGVLLRVFRNRYAGVGMGLVIVVFALTLVCLAVYFLAGCQGGLDSNSQCSQIPDSAGDFFFTGWYLGYQYLIYFALPATGVNWAAEIITRGRLIASGERL